jgi:hypothetical protein
MSEEAFQSFEALRNDVAVKTARLCEHIESETDVKRVMALEALPCAADGGDIQRWLYLIETPFMTFPKYALGTTNAGNNDVRILMTCSAEWRVIEAFDEALKHGGVLPRESD